jgi:hypothetical protein
MDDNQGKTGSMYVLLEKHKYFVCGLKIPAFAGTTMGGLPRRFGTQAFSPGMTKSDSSEPQGDSSSAWGGGRMTVLGD